MYVLIIVSKQVGIQVILNMFRTANLLLLSDLKFFSVIVLILTRSLKWVITWPDHTTVQLKKVWIVKLRVLDCIRTNVQIRGDTYYWIMQQLLDLIGSNVRRGGDSYYSIIQQLLNRIGSNVRREGDTFYSIMQQLLDEWAQMYEEGVIITTQSFRNF